MKKGWEEVYRITSMKHRTMKWFRRARMSSRFAFDSTVIRDLYIYTLQMSTCGTNLRAIDHANSRNNKGLRSTGVGVVVCARHTFIRPNAAGDLQRGERYMNMDYILLNTLSGTTVNRICIIYNVVCQWHKNFIQRMQPPPPQYVLRLFWQDH